MRGHRTIGAVDERIVEAGFVYARLQVVRDDDLRAALDKFERAHV